MTGKTILVLGGGIGGLTAANELQRLLPPGNRIVLVEKNPTARFCALVLVVDDRRPAARADHAGCAPTGAARRRGTTGRGAGH